MEYRYKPEDAVFVRPDLKRGSNYWMRSGVNKNKQCLVAIGDMLNFVGKWFIFLDILGMVIITSKKIRGNGAGLMICSLV